MGPETAIFPIFLLFISLAAFGALLTQITILQLLETPMQEAFLAGTINGGAEGVWQLGREPFYAIRKNKVLEYAFKIST